MRILIPTNLCSVMAPPPVSMDGAGKAAAHSVGEGHADHGADARGGPGGMREEGEWDRPTAPTANLSDEGLAGWPYGPEDANGDHYKAHACRPGVCVCPILDPPAGSSH